MKALRLLALAVLLFAVSCSDAGEISAPEPVSSVIVQPDSLTLTVGQSRRLVATVYGRDGRLLEGRLVSWSTRNDSIVSVDAMGNATARRPGAATVSATAEGRRGETRITVRAAVQAVARVEIAPPGTISLEVGTTRQLAATAYAADDTELNGRAVHWASSDSARVSVDSTGLLAARDTGSARVTATIEGIGASAEVRVAGGTGIPGAVARVTLDADSLALEEGTTRQLVATAWNANGQVVTGHAAVWTSSSPDVAHVSAGGWVTPVRPGTATITARVHGKTATVPVRVFATYGFDLLFDAFTGTMTEVLRQDLRTPGGQPTRIFPNARWAADPAASPDGARIAVVRQSATGARGIWLVDPDGTDITELTSGADDQPAWSPDGRRIAFRRRIPGGGTDIWVVNADGSGLTDLTADHGPTSQSSPTWSPDGRIAYSHAAAGEAHLWTMAADGSGKRQITTGSVYDDEPSWSPDGSRIAFRRFGNLWLVNAAGGGERVLVLLPYVQSSPAWSPDGVLIAFSASDGTGTHQIFTVRADGSGFAQRTFDAIAGGSPAHPAWILRR